MAASSSSSKFKFDEQHKFVTSAIFPPWWLACIRLLLALYTLVASLFTLIWEARGFDSGSTAGSYFSYFTNLSYIGICAYFFASGVQTFAYAQNLKQGKDEYPLQHWPWILRYLHGLLFSTIATFPILVTIVYWALLSSASTFDTPYSTWSNISKHALNSVMVIFDDFGRLSWHCLYHSCDSRDIYLFFSRPEERGKATGRLYCWNCRGSMYHLLDHHRLPSPSRKSHEAQKRK